MKGRSSLPFVLLAAPERLVRSHGWPAPQVAEDHGAADMECCLSTWAARCGALALRVLVWSARWVAVRRLLCATRGQADIRGSGWPQDRGSSWGAAV